MGVKLQSALGGSVELNAPSTASNFTMTVPAGNGTVATTNQLTNFRNKVINGNFDIWQRGVGATSSTGYLADHWVFSVGGMNLSQQRVADYPTGANGYCIEGKITNTSSSVVEFAARQYIEKQMMNDFVENPVSVSFWYKSNRTGTHAVRFGVQDATGANLDNNQSFTVNAANTWEYKTVTGLISAQSISNWNMAARPNVSGAFLDIGFKVTGGSGGPGFTSLTANDYFRLTRVQLEVGSVCTQFETRPPTIENDLCRRYYRRMAAGDSYAYIGHLGYFESPNILQLPVEITGMRTNQLTAAYSGALQCEQVGGDITGLAGLGLRGTNFARVQFSTAISATSAGLATPIRTNNDINAYFEISGVL